MAGIVGEQLVATELGRALGRRLDAVPRGYRNRRGEIDQLLLGPRGLFAIEVKNLNAAPCTSTATAGGPTSTTTTATWSSSGRSRTGWAARPSVQLNEPADDLERFLAERGQPGRDGRVVILAHRRSGLGPVRNPTVEALTCPVTCWP